jgi:hypothetical protein
MLPREVIIGVVVVTIQLFYSLVYPYAEQSLQSLPKFAAEVEALISNIPRFNSPDQAASDDTEAFTPDKPAQPQQKQSKKKERGGGQRVSREDVLGQVVSQRMIPHMSSITDTFKINGNVDVPPRKELKVSWDVRRVLDAEWPWAYMFRVRVKNVSPYPCPLQGVARFYVLRAPDGQVFPIHRITEGPASFTLNAGEEYKYAWIFFTKYQTLEAAGGLLLENKAKEDGRLEERFLNTTLAPLEPAKAEGITSERVQKWMNNYNFMGALDLREVTYV